MYCIDYLESVAHRCNIIIEMLCMFRVFLSFLQGIQTRVECTNLLKLEFIVQFLLMKENLSTLYKTGRYNIMED